MTRAARLSAVAAAVVAAVAATTSSRVRRAGRSGALAPADAILVFGAGVWPTGPSLSLRVRVERAFEVYAAGLAPTILCSGGWSSGVSEATVMRSLLVERGVPPDAVIADDSGVTTRAAIRSARDFGAGRWRRVIAVSSPYHMHRIHREAARQGLDVVLCPARRLGPRTRELLRFDVRQHVREVMAVPAYAAGWQARRALDRGAGRRLRSAVLDVRGRVRSFAGEADAVAGAGELVAARIKAAVDGFTDTAAVLTPAAGLDWPAAGPVGSRFGLRYRRLHSGIDIRACHGAPVTAAAEGRVLMVGRLAGYGNLIVIDHGGGLATVYAHLAGSAVAEGDAVTRGQPIGFIGSTGRSFGPHLHFEARVHGTPIDPLVYLTREDDGATLRT